jgi:hypothetical protein
LYVLEVVLVEAEDVLQIVLVFLHQEGKQKYHAEGLADRGTDEDVSPDAVFLEESEGSEEVVSEVDLSVFGNRKIKCLELLGVGLGRSGGRRQHQDGTDCVF